MALKGGPCSLRSQPVGSAASGLTTCHWLLHPGTSPSLPGWTQRPSFPQGLRALALSRLCPVCTPEASRLVARRHSQLIINLSCPRCYGFQVRYQLLCRHSEGLCSLWPCFWRLPVLWFAVDLQSSSPFLLLLFLFTAASVLCSKKSCWHTEGPETPGDREGLGPRLLGPEGQSVGDAGVWAQAGKGPWGGWGPRWQGPFCSLASGYQPVLGTALSPQ